MSGGMTSGGSAAGTGAAAGAGTGGVPEVGGCDGVTCAREASCETSPAPHCVCPAGYTDPQGDGTVCEDVDECATDNGGCDTLAECKNTPGSFSCGGCPTGYEEQGGQCVDIDECATDNGGCDALTTCKNTPGGRSCGACPGLSCGGSCCAAPPANAVSVCDESDACAVECRSGYHSCSGSPRTCYPNADVLHCGSSCAVCSQPNATASCTNGACTYSCPAGLALGCLHPDGRPVCSKWDFESNTVEGFAINAANTTGSDGRFATSTKHATSGSRSLAVGYVGTDSNELVEVKLKLCPGGQGLDLSKRTLSLDLFAETASGSTPFGSNSGNYISVTGKGGEYFGGCDSVTPTSDTAFKWTCPASAWPTDTAEITFVLRVFAKWSGTFYLDNIKLQ